MMVVSKDIVTFEKTERDEDDKTVGFTFQQSRRCVRRGQPPDPREHRADDRIRRVSELSGQRSDVSSRARHASAVALPRSGTISTPFPSPRPVETHSFLLKCRQFPSFYKKRLAFVFHID